VRHTGRVRDLITQLRNPWALLSHAEISAQPSPVPAVGGTYGLHFTEAPHPSLNADELLYVGISPGSARSKETLRSRIGYHFSGDAEGSTVRMTLGCLLGIPLRLRERTDTKTFGPEGEAALTRWMVRHTRVCWHLGDEPWTTKPAAIAQASTPLNVRYNPDHPFHPVLSEIRAAALAEARRLPRI
jgi:hypothetical protein